MSFHSSSSQYASSNPDSEHSSPSTAPSSIHACADSDEEHFEALQRDMGGFVSGLIKRIKKQEETEILLRAWSTRCETLEGEVVRLSKVCQQLEAEKAAKATAPELKVSLSAPLSRRHLFTFRASAAPRPFGFAHSLLLLLLLDSRNRLRMERQVVVSQDIDQPSSPCYPSNRPQQEHEVRLRFDLSLRRSSQRS